MPIVKLDNKTIEKIAAGEVIESPMSIVKELVENSIDSKADSITVEIKNGGKTYIRVTDNGCGIERDDLELAFSKHATSKIKDFNDLFDIYSLGFRGEALSSIATVSKVTAITKTKDQDIGSKIVIDNGISKISSIATNVGTSIIAEDIFRDIPVRRKFLKSDAIEANKINRLMYAFAIGYNNISFKYIKNDNLLFTTNKSYDFKTKVSDLLDDSLGDNLLEIKGSNDEYKIKGYISNSNYYRGNRSLQYLFINNRLVDSDIIVSTVEHAYKNNIPSNRFPAFFLFVTTDAKNLDVNIHPNKKTINFNYEESLLNLIENSILKAISNNYKPNEIRFVEDKDDELMDFTDYSKLLNEYNNTNKFVKENYNETKYESQSQNNEKSQSNVLDDDFFDLEANILNEDKRSHINTNHMNTKSKQITTLSKDSFIDEIDHIEYKTSFMGRYSLFEQDNTLYILNHRRASEKINITKFMNDFKSKSVASQILIDAKIINLMQNDVEKFKQKQEFIKKLGFDAEIIGESSIIIRSVPVIFEIPENDDFFYDLLDIDYDMGTDYIYKKIKKSKLNLLFRKGNKIGEKEATTYLKELFSMENPYKTLDGKPTIIKVSEEDLEKYFER